MGGLVARVVAPEVKRQSDDARVRSNGCQRSMAGGGGVRGRGARRGAPAAACHGVGAQPEPRGAAVGDAVLRSRGGTSSRRAAR